MKRVLLYFATLPVINSNYKVGECNGSGSAILITPRVLKVYGVISSNTSFYEFIYSELLSNRNDVTFDPSFLIKLPSAFMYLERYSDHFSVRKRYLEYVT